MKNVYHYNLEAFNTQQNDWVIYDLREHILTEINNSQLANLIIILYEKTLITDEDLMVDILPMNNLTDIEIRQKP